MTGERTRANWDSEGPPAEFTTETSPTPSMAIAVPQATAPGCLITRTSGGRGRLKRRGMKAADNDATQKKAAAGPHSIA